MTPVPVGSIWLDTRAEIPAALACHSPQLLRRAVTVVSVAPAGKLTLLGQWQLWDGGSWKTILQRRTFGSPRRFTLARFQRLP